MDYDSSSDSDSSDDGLPEISLTLSYQERDKSEDLVPTSPIKTPMKMPIQIPSDICAANERGDIENYDNSPDSDSSDEGLPELNSHQESDKSEDLVLTPIATPPIKMTTSTKIPSDICVVNESDDIECYNISSESDCSDDGLPEISLILSQQENDKSDDPIPKRTSPIITPTKTPSRMPSNVCAANERDDTESPATKLQPPHASPRAAAPLPSAKGTTVQEQVVDDPTLNKENSTDQGDEEPPSKRAKLQSRRANLNSVREGQMNISDMCIACGDTEVSAEHPLFHGGLCRTCMDHFMLYYNYLDKERKQNYCTICSGVSEEAGDVFICDSENCAKVYCTLCVRDLCGYVELEKVRAADPWQCYMCSPTPSEVGLLAKREDWEKRLQEDPPLEAQTEALEPVIATGSSSSPSCKQKSVKPKVLKGRKNIKPSSVRRKQCEGKRWRCGKCEACLTPECGKCEFCRDKTKFGGPNRKRKPCKYRICENLRQPKQPAEDDTKSDKTPPKLGRPNRQKRSIFLEPRIHRQPKQPADDTISDKTHFYDRDKSKFGGSNRKKTPSKICWLFCKQPKQPTDETRSDKTHRDEPKFGGPNRKKPCKYRVRESLRQPKVDKPKFGRPWPNRKTPCKQPKQPADLTGSDKTKFGLIRQKKKLCKYRVRESLRQPKQPADDAKSDKTPFSKSGEMHEDHEPVKRRTLTLNRRLLDENSAITERTTAVQRLVRTESRSSISDILQKQITALKEELSVKEKELHETKDVYTKQLREKQSEISRIRSTISQQASKLQEQLNTVGNEQIQQLQCKDQQITKLNETVLHLKQNLHAKDNELMKLRRLLEEQTRSPQKMLKDREQSQKTTAKRKREQ